MGGGQGVPVRDADEMAQYIGLDVASGPERAAESMVEIPPDHSYSERQRHHLGMDGARGVGAGHEDNAIHPKLRGNLPDGGRRVTVRNPAQGGVGLHQQYDISPGELRRLQRRFPVGAQEPTDYGQATDAEIDRAIEGLVRSWKGGA